MSRRRPDPSPATQGALALAPPHAEPAAWSSALAASAQIMPANARLAPKYETWQTQLWNLYDTVGEFAFAVGYMANMVSRVRLVPVELLDNEPVPVETGAARDLVDDLAGGIEGQGQLMGEMAVHLSVPGEGWLVGEAAQPSDADAEDSWRMLSADELRVPRGGRFRNRYEIRESDDNSAWRPLSEDSLVVRVWRPHPRWGWRATSPGLKALGALVEVDAINKRVLATILSRLASNGILLYDKGRLSFPARATPTGNGETEADPFAQILVDVARRGIKDPSSPEAVLPIPIGYMIDDITDVDPKMLLQFIQGNVGIDDKMLALRESALRRLATTANLPAEILLGTADCVDSETEILTSHGWRRGHEVEAGDLALTLNHDTGCSEWQPIQAMNRYEVTDEPMLRMAGRAHDSLTTLNHRWPVVTTCGVDGSGRRREFTTSGELHSGHRIPTAAPCADLPVEAKYSDDLVELAAWFWTEGSWSRLAVRPGGWGRASIAQSHTVNPERVDRIRGALDRLFGRGNWGSEHVQSPGLGSPITVFQLRKHVYEELHEATGGKIVRQEFVQALTRAQLELFIDVSCQGDGWHYRQGHLDIWQRDARALDAFELALILSGRSVTRTEYAGGWVVYGSASGWTRPMKAAAAATSDPARRAVAERTTYTGTVWCPTTPNGTWFARRNGKYWYTGNSNHWGQWFVEESAIKAHIVPDVELMCHALSTGYLRPSLRAANESLIGPNGGRLAIWYDPSDIVARPDKSANVFEAYDRLEISPSSLRREIGMGEAEAPTVEELKEMLLKSTARSSMALAGPAIEKLTGIELKAQTPPAVVVNRASPTGPVPQPEGREPRKSPTGPPDQNDRPEDNAPESQGE